LKVESPALADSDSESRIRMVGIATSSDVCILLSADCLLPSVVASFFKKLSAFSRRPSERTDQLKVQVDLQ